MDRFTAETHGTELNNSGYRFANCQIDLQRRELYVDDRPVEIQPKVFDLLCYLVENRDRVVDKDELLDTIWSGTVVSDASLSQSIRKARSILGDDGNRQELIRTVQRRGYRFVADVDSLPAATEVPAASAARQATLADTPPAQNSIAVLPFTNMSPEQENEYFSDGLSEELLNLLARIPQLQVAARTSSFAFRDSREDVRSIGARLNVAHVLEGSVRKSGDRVRVTAQLIESATGFQVSSQTFDRRLDDIFQLQDDIASAVVHQLMPTLLGDTPAQASKIHPDAYTLYLQGRHHYRKSTAEGFAAAIHCFEQAIEIDSGFAAAWDLMGMVRIRQTEMGVMPKAECYARGYEAVKRAVELDPELAEAHSHLGWIAMTHEWDFVAAESHIKRSLELAPRSYVVLAQAGALAFILGRMSQCVALREQALALDPVSRGGYHNMGSALLNAGRADEAEAMFRRALDLAPDYIGGWFYRGLPALLRGDAAGALDLFERERDPGWRLEGQTMALFSLGREQDSDAALQAMTRDYATDMLYQLAETHAWRGEVDEAFAWLDRAYEARDGGLVEMLPNPLLHKLRDDPRWAGLLQRMGLPPEVS